MDLKKLDDALSVSPQITPGDVVQIARLGFRSIVCNRPDGEEQGQPSQAEIAAAAEAAGLQFAYVPAVPDQINAQTAEAMAAALSRLPAPVVAYCRSGARSAKLAEMAGAVAPQPGAGKVYDIVIVGGGSAGIATAASILKRNRDASVAIVEPSEAHYYQPGWTMVGGGIFDRKSTRREEARLIPRGAEWIRASASGFAPDENEVILCDGTRVAYRVLVVCPGIELDWDAIPGLRQTLGENGVTSNYSYEFAPYTDRLVRDLRSGIALFTQPVMPIKCAGAPQKAMYLSCYRWEKGGVLGNIDVQFHTAGAALFGVAAYVPALMEYVQRYGVELNLGSQLVAINGPSRRATFERTVGDRKEHVELGFDMIHVVPPQRAPEFVRTSPLAAPSGFVEVDEKTLRHPRHANVFALGDACSASNAKTAAAVRKQAPVVAVNALAALAGEQPVADYDGYGSCPLTVEAGKIVLAEFGYGGRLLPTFPTWLIDGTRPSRLAWLLKDTILPPVYWHGMLKGREWLVKPHRIGR
jgi:sulfide:quinone oxidoreductase